MTGSTVVEPSGPGGRRGRSAADGLREPRVRPRRSPEDHDALRPGIPGSVGPPEADAVPVLAVLVAHDGAAWLPRALAALAVATRRPDVLVAVDTGSGDGSGDLLAAAPQVSAVVTLPRTASPGQAVSIGVARAREVLAASWVPSTGRRAKGVEPLVWVLHDDCAPAPDALDMLLGAVVAAPTVAVAGCKLLAWDDPAALLEVGVTVSPSGRRVTGLAPGERDQGQHDSRSDVLAVSTAGALLRWDVVESVGGFDPAVPLAGDDIDLCRRVRAAGHRVVVVPAARCGHAAALETGARAGDALLGPRAAR
ncbi:MAG: glycosyltransferase family 2 protein, partial [Kineosporiaceae bacterium]